MPNPKSASWSRVAMRRKAPPPSSFGAGWGGGPLWVDSFKSRRAPTPYELIEAYKSLIYACVKLNAQAVARLPLRLYATTGEGQGRSKRLSLKPVSRVTKHRLKTLH